MEFDAIPFDRMSPDSSQWLKGLHLVVNAVPHDAGSWREVRTLALRATETFPVDEGPAYVGSFSDPLGPIFVGVAEPVFAKSRILLYDPAIQTLTNVTPGTDYAGSPRRWRFAKFGVNVVAAPENMGLGSALELQVRSGSGNFADLVPGTDRPAPKYLCVSRVHVVGGHNQATGGAGVYASADPFMYMWCARNDATEWEPGVDAAGFASVNGSLGEITGIAGFEEFFLIFQEYGVTRATWVGGNLVWELQSIAGEPFGIANKAWSQSIVTMGRHALYLSNCGFAVIRDGEVAEMVGEGDVRRYFMGEAGPDIISAAVFVEGAYDFRTGHVVWTAFRGSSLATYFQVCYHPASQRFSTLQSGGPHGLACALAGQGRRPLSNLIFFQAVARELRVYQTGTTATLAITLLTSRWRPETGKRRSLASMRPLLLLDLAGGGAYPTITIEVTPILEPRAAGAAAVTFTSAFVSESGWWESSSFPLEGGEFIFRVTIPDLGPEPAIVEIPALETAFIASQNDF